MKDMREQSVLRPHVSQILMEAHMTNELRHNLIKQQYIALFPTSRRGSTCKRHLPSESLVFPGVIFGDFLGECVVENMVDNLMSEWLEPRLMKVLLQI